MIQRVEYKIQTKYKGYRLLAKDLRQGLALGLGLGLRLAIQFVKMATFDGPDGVQGWESDEKRIFGQRFGPTMWKNRRFSKARVSVRVRVRVRVSFSVCENAHSSPRMPHTLGEIFAHAQSLDFKNRNS